jgi:S-formylglutathione hydrolase FrmB
MALLSVQFFGAAIQKAASLCVILPERKGPFPVLYLLHGLSDDQTAWQRRTSLERYVEGLPLIVVMPDGGRSWYANDPRPFGLAYEDHIDQDVIGFVDRAFPTIPTRKGRAIAGLSMGGYGAVMHALRRPDLYSVACSHSGAVATLYKPLSHRQPLLDVLPRAKYDCFTLAAKAKKAGRKVALRLDCGTEDFLLAQNRAFHAHLTKLGLPHEYAEYPGAHTWEYWDRHIGETIEFVKKHLGVKA